MWTTATRDVETTAPASRKDANFAHQAAKPEIVLLCTIQAADKH